MFTPFSYTPKYSKKESKNNGGLNWTLKEEKIKENQSVRKWQNGVFKTGF